MSKRKAKSKHRVSRSTKKVKLHQLASLITPKSLEPQHIREAKVRTDLPVHYGGEISNIDPRFPEGSRLRHEANREASRFLHCRAAVGVGDHTTITMLEPHGWQVRNWHGDEDNKVFEHSNITRIDETAQSRKTTRNRRQATDEKALAIVLKNKALRARRDAYDFEAARQTEIMQEL